MDTRKGEVRLAAVADIHCSKTSQGSLQGFFGEIANSADVLLICGDLTAYGLPEEARILAKELTAAAKIPIVAVLGNHEFESDRQAEVAEILSDVGVRLLDGESCEIAGVGFAGVKGFGGGFKERSLEPWGEKTMKQFVREAVEETLKLGSALARLRTPRRIALVHYSPIQETVEGEPREIFPFLGSSRLEEPIDRYSVTAVFHGHAHNGRPEGRTRGGVPVYNVAMSLLQRQNPGRPPFLQLTIPTGQASAAPPAPVAPPGPAPSSASER